MKVISVRSIKNKKILVLGGTGFLGNKLISSLLNENLQIYLLVRKSRTRKDLQKYKSNPNIKVFDWKLTDSNIIEEILNLYVSHILSEKIIWETLIKNEYLCVTCPFKENITEILIKHNFLHVKHPWKEIYRRKFEFLCV